jgi:poly-gamma-glutamate synthesis protein (capsule biosynthesis protein)
MFSSPDALASACKDAGIDVLVTANNHCVDRGKTGLERTIRILDSLNIMHTGTFLSYSDKQKKSPLIIEKKSFRIALVSYTAETNEIPVPEPSFVNIIRKKQLLDDIARAKLAKPDALILFLHWGIEKQKAPGEGQLALADLCFKAGADIIIGSHPHVVQKSIWINRYGRGKFAAFSLGNFIANQKAPGTDGGQMIQLTLSRKDGIAAVSKANYILTWIYGPGTRLNRKFYILPCRDYEESPEFFAAPGYYKRMKEFISESGRLLDSQNKNVDEME